MGVRCSKIANMNGTQPMKGRRYQTYNIILNIPLYVYMKKEKCAETTNTKQTNTTNKQQTDDMSSLCCNTISSIVLVYVFSFHSIIMPAASNTNGAYIYITHI